MDMKTCTKCNQEYPATREHFYKNGKRLRPDCKTCTNKTQKSYVEANRELVAQRKHDYTQAHKKSIAQSRKKYYEENKEHTLATNKRYRESNKETIAIKSREYRDKNRDSLIEKSHQYYEENKKRLLNNMQEYYQENRETIIARNVEYAENNREKRREYLAQYREDNKEQIRLNSKVHSRKAGAKRRARVKNLPHSFSELEWLDCLEYFNHSCAVCGSQLRDLFGDTVPHADHWIPLASEECAGTIASNMVCLCNHCNLSKGATMPQVWLARHYSKKEVYKIVERVEEYFLTVF